MNKYFSTAAGQERAIARLLHYGTGLASFVIAAGLALQWLHPFIRTIFSVSGYELVKTGVGLFIFLPVSRVILMLIQFSLARDHAFIAISALVLTVVGAGFLLGI
ncbi:DUF1634 domain-containing protein [Brucella sp. HL-2]|nr:DUF1634 domain-containing protein [Brucella sp. HL-2]MCV9907767.1 DUF1634 domain-containing protein [Brucella sp. HL-2]